MSELPRELASLDAELRSLPCGPRASLGAEIAGRAARGEGPSGGGRASRRPALALALCAGLLLAAGAAWLQGWRTTRDLCCADHDGSPFARDGVLVTTDWRGEVRRLVVYEDRDGTRSLSVGDVMHLDHPSSLPADPDAARSFTASTHCCADLDGEGEEDDGVVVGMADGKVVMATVYQTSGRERNRRGP